MKEMKIEPWEEICDGCDGNGIVASEIDDEKDDIKYYIHSMACPKCLGSGKLNWLEKIFGKESNLMDEITKKLSEEIAKDLDNQIVRSLTTIVKGNEV